MSRKMRALCAGRHASGAGLVFAFRTPHAFPMRKSAIPTPPLPKTGQQRAWWRAPASPSALAFHVAAAASAHGAPLLVVARDNQGAHQLESDLHTLLGAQQTGLPV